MNATDITTNASEHRVTIERVQDREYRGFEVTCRPCEWSVLRGNADSAADAGQEHIDGYEVK